MNQGKYVFSQIFEFIDQYELNKCITRYEGNKKVRNLTCCDQFLAMMFGQLANLQSLRGTVLCLNAHSRSMYHMGFRSSKLVLTTLTRANEKRDWKIYRDFAQLMIQKAKVTYKNDKLFSSELAETPFVIDSTTIEICLSTFKWAQDYFNQGFGGVKIHTQLSLRGNIPSFFSITDLSVPDFYILDEIFYEKDSYYIMDKGYYDFRRLYRINLCSAYFVIRSKINISAKRICSKKVNKAAGIYQDHIINLRDSKSKKKYPDKLRKIKYYDQKQDKYYVFLTNNFQQKAELIAELYKNRWKIELFFKWIKQHLNIEIFWGHSLNAVKIQICIVLSTFWIVAIMKKKLNIDKNLFEILQVLSVSLFEKTPIKDLFSNNDDNFLDQKAQKRLFEV